MKLSKQVFRRFVVLLMLAASSVCSLSRFVLVLLFVLSRPASFFLWMMGSVLMMGSSVSTTARPPRSVIFVVWSLRLVMASTGMGAIMLSLVPAMLPVPAR